MKDTLKKLFWISRPISWPNTSYPFLIGFLLTQTADATASSLALLILGTIYFIGPYNLLMYGINDVYDYESDIKNPRKGGVEGMKESRAFHPTILRATLVTNLPFLIPLLILSNTAGRIALLVSVFFVVAYSLKGLRFKEVAVLDSITSSLHFVGPLIYALALTNSLNDAWAWVVAFFAWGIASHAFGAIQDIIPDRKAGIHSIATLFGARPTLWLVLIMYGFAASIVLMQGMQFIVIGLAGLGYVANCLPHLGVTDKTSAHTNKGWKRFLWLNYLTGAIITITVVLQVTLA